MYTKQDYIKLATTHIKREGLSKLLEGLEKSDFYVAPASTIYHDNVRVGLCHHSVQVFHELEFESKGKQNLESLAIVALFHDICKIGYYEESTKNVKDDKTGVWHKEPFYKVNDLFPLGHGEKSLYLVQSCMEVKPEEALAIRWHMGGFEPESNYKYLSTAYGQCPLAVMLHLADMRATYLSEEK